MDRLTPREHEVAMLAARGLGNRDIARELGLSTGTVKLHMHKILKKLGVKSKSEVVLMVLRDGPKRSG